MIMENNPKTMHYPVVREENIVGIEDKNSKYIQSICWYCKKATNSDKFNCSWSARLVMPKSAKVVKINNAEFGGYYKIKECGEFISDEVEK